jgi:hypothetical protein
MLFCIDYELSVRVRTYVRMYFDAYSLPVSCIHVYRYRSTGRLTDRSRHVYM